ncbi:MAG: cation:proton antiporter [Spirochaetia bacterium]
MPGFPMPFQDPVLVFGTIMIIILIAPLLAKKAGLPEIIGLILAGILVGPFGLGLLERSESIQLIGKVGLLYIMFLAGLEIDLHQVKKNKSHTIIFGLVTFSIPLVMGTALGFWAFGMSIPIAMLLASMFSSHTLLTFPALGKLGLTKSRPATTTVGGTIITDTLALIVLAVVVSSSHSEITWFFWVKLFSLMTLYMGATLFLIPKIGRWFFSRLGTNEELEYIFVMALTFTVSYLAYLAGLEPIIGAFLAGLSLNSLIPEKSILATRLHFTGNAIFIPFFLISVGMLVNLRLLAAGADVWIVIIGMSTVAILSKFLAAKLSQVLLKYRPSEGTLIFGLSVNQAAATLAAVLVGFNADLFSDNIITGTIIMIAVTSLVGSLITQRAGKKVALEEEQKEYDHSSAPHRILIPLAQREGAKELVDLAVLLRNEGSSEPVYPVSVTSESINLEKDLADAEKILAHSVVRAMSANIPVTPLTSVDLNTASGIVRAARENRISMITASWDGEHPGGSRIFGKTLDEVIDRSSQMVMVTRIVKPVNSVKRMVVILPPFGERQKGFEAFISMIKNLAHQTGASILILAAHSTLNSVKQFIINTQPKTETAFEAFAVWKNILNVFAGLRKSGDWIILMSARKGEIAWQPSLDRLPREFVKTGDKFNFSAVFPPAKPWESARAAETISNEEKLISGFDRERSIFRMNAASPEEAVQTLVSRYFGKRSPNTRTTTELLHRISQEEPVELTKDVILLHTHLPFVDDSVIFLGVNSLPLNIPKATECPHIIIVLLDPVDQDPENHLKSLTDIARVIRLPGMVEALQNIRNFDEFLTEVHKRL